MCTDESLTAISQARIAQVKNMDPAAMQRLQEAMQGLGAAKQKAKDEV